jgi:hypothetical protein
VKPVADATKDYIIPVAQQMTAGNNIVISVEWVLVFVAARET